MLTVGDQTSLLVCSIAAVEVCFFPSLPRADLLSPSLPDVLFRFLGYLIFGIGIQMTFAVFSARTAWEKGCRAFVPRIG